MRIASAPFFRQQKVGPCWRHVVCVLLISTLLGCNQPPETVAPAPESATEESAKVNDDLATEKEASAKSKPAAEEDKVSTKDRPKPLAPALKPGQYCYQSSDEIKDLYARVTVDKSDRVIGKMQGTIHDEKQGYFTSYSSNLDGTIDGSNLNLDVATWIEFDKQNAQEIWRVSPDSLSTDRDKLMNSSCDEVNKVFQNENGLEAEDLTQSANNVKTQTVYFDAGKSGTTVSGVVVRGDRDVYVLNAQGGQILYPNITSTEDNATFDIVDPSGMILATEVSSTEQIYLPHTGDYQLIVGGTRGNATYDFEIAIE